MNILIIKGSAARDLGETLGLCFKIRGPLSPYVTYFQGNVRIYEQFISRAVVPWVKSGHFCTVSLMKLTHMYGHFTFHLTFPAQLDLKCD